MARDLKVHPSELATLTKKGPNAADLLQKLLVALGVDAKGLEHDDPSVMRDLQRLCTTCADKRQCQFDLANGVIAENFRDYCPNSFTLERIAAGETVALRRCGRDHAGAFDRNRAGRASGPVFICFGISRRNPPRRLDDIGCGNLSGGGGHHFPWLVSCRLYQRNTQGVAPSSRDADGVRPHTLDEQPSADGRRINRCGDKS